MSNAATTPLQVRSDHGCFGCGAGNPHGLHLSFTADANGVQATYTPRVVDQGYEQIIHGGIIATLLDEAMAWAVAAAGIWAVTGEMQVRFRRPLHVGETVSLRGAVTDQRSRAVTTSGQLVREADGQVIATATALFVRVPAATEAAWQARYLAAP
ncbi:MAG: PaaI family thioesterase [Thermomicrobiales bacterium]|nr:PaaI family thioesterase [Thermomicrobiales bacterium]